MEQEPWKLVWQDELSVGIAEVDEDHKRFIQLVNDLNEAIAGKKGLTEIRRRMQLIMEDADLHFAHEERLFREWNYPDADDHAAKHEEVRQQCRKILGQFSDQSFETEWIAAGLQVKKILVAHLLTADMKYRDYYRAAHS